MHRNLLPSRLPRFACLGGVAALLVLAVNVQPCSAQYGPLYLRQQYLLQLQLRQQLIHQALIRQELAREEAQRRHLDRKSGAEQPRTASGTRGHTPQTKATDRTAADKTPKLATKAPPNTAPREQHLAGNALDRHHSNAAGQAMLRPQKMLDLKNSPLFHGEHRAALSNPQKAANHQAADKPAAQSKLQPQKATQRLAQQVPVLQQKITQFGLDHLGQPTALPGQADNCATFVEAALQNSGAKGDGYYPKSLASGNYAWGNLVAQHKAGGPLSDFKRLQPGDVLQFRGVVSTVTTKQGNGRWTSSWDFPHHSAIVYQNLGGGRLVLLEENFNDQQFVTRDTVDLSGMTSGTVWAYQPVSAQSK